MHHIFVIMVHMEKTPEKFKDYTFKTEMRLHLADHETFLSFNSDWQSEAFEDWLSTEGMSHFAKWLEEEEVNYND